MSVLGILTQVLFFTRKIFLAINPSLQIHSRTFYTLHLSFWVNINVKTAYLCVMTSIYIKWLWFNCVPFICGLQTISSPRCTILKDWSPQPLFNLLASHSILRSFVFYSAPSHKLMNLEQDLGRKIWVWRSSFGCAQCTAWVNCKQVWVRAWQPMLSKQEWP